MPTQEQIHQVRLIIEGSLRELIEKDRGIFLDLIDDPIILDDEFRILDRKLHEVSINHCFANYLEKRTREIPELQHHFVDLEYNRFNLNLKYVRTRIGRFPIRPDILVHTRTNRIGVLQHYLAIEAKKGEVNDWDIDKVNGLISDPDYRYLFGLVVSYCNDPDNITSRLYYRGQRGDIVEVPINIPVN